MLILTRRAGESIQIGDEIAVTLLGVQGLQARIGVQAPTSVEIHRNEVYARIQAERAAMGPEHIDERVRQAAERIDPRNLFARLNPIGASPDELEQGRNGFVDDRTHGDYLIFLAGFKAAQEVAL